MRRQGQYADSGVNVYVTAQMQHMSGQRMEHKSGHFQGRLEGLNSEEHLYGTSKVDGQWRWERDGSKVSTPMPSHVFNEGNGYALTLPLHSTLISYFCSDFLVYLGCTTCS